jgi:hypothetical protein
LAGGGGGGSLTKISSYSALTNGLATPVVAYNATGVVAGQWMLVYVVSPNADAITTLTTSGLHAFSPLVASQDDGGYKNTLFAFKLVSGDLTGTPSFTLDLPNDGSGLGAYVTVEVVDAPGCNTVQTYPDWFEHDFTNVGSVTMPTHASITGSIGYNMMALEFSAAGTAHTVSPGTIRNDVTGTTTSGGSDGGHSHWASFISPASSGPHVISGYGSTTTAWQGYMMEFGT